MKQAHVVLNYLYGYAHNCWSNATHFCGARSLDRFSI